MRYSTLQDRQRRGGEGGQRLCTLATHGLIDVTTYTVQSLSRSKYILRHCTPVCRATPFAHVTRVGLVSVCKLAGECVRLGSMSQWLHTIFLRRAGPDLYYTAVDDHLHAMRRGGVHRVAHRPLCILYSTLLYPRRDPV